MAMEQAMMARVLGRHKVRTAIGTAFLGVGSGIGVTIGTATGPPPWTSPSATAPCPPHNPPGVVCNSATQASDSAQGVGAAAQQWPVAASRYISESQAIADAESQTGTSGAPAHAKRMNYQAATQLLGAGENGNPDINPSTEVWVVTVFASPGGLFSVSSPVPSGSPQSSTTTTQAVPYFTVIEDAANGSMMAACACGVEITSG
jgi:hypothetical protein